MGKKRFERHPDELRRDMSSFYVNIDKLFQSIRETQDSLGMEPTMEYAVKDEKTERRFKRFQRRSVEEEAAYQKALKKMKERRKNSSSPENKLDLKEDGTPSMCGLKSRIYNTSLTDDEDDDGIYICEWCNKLGYRRKYNPTICDNCTECVDNCTELSDGTCSGCSFSVYREGRPYSDFLNLNDMISEEDLAVFDMIQKESSDDKIKNYNIKFDVSDL